MSYPSSSSYPLSERDIDVSGPSEVGQNEANASSLSEHLSRQRMFVAYDWVRSIRRLHRRDFFGGQFDIHCLEDFFEVVRLGSANDRRSDAWRLQDPGARELRWGYAPFFGDLLRGKRDKGIGPAIIVVRQFAVARHLGFETNGNDRVFGNPQGLET